MYSQTVNKKKTPKQAITKQIGYLCLIIY